MAKANTELKPSRTQERETLKEEDFETLKLEDSCVTDDSDADPTFDLFQETRSRISKLSLTKSTPRKAKEIDSESEDEEESFGVEIPELNVKDGKCFEKVEELIKDGHVEKLKVEQCKVYLRKYGLRLTGNKSILIERIKEHLEIFNGGGEKKYPIYSFVLNCKGDACTGDVVMFEQNVYEMFSIALRSAMGPPCGTRIVAGRIVKESYGAAKQQHTFTIEVLWSKGEKPLQPLHPLLIKGRNLYRLKTMRQRWADEEERRKVVQEKHSRGFVARSSRDTRIKEKEMRKMGIMRRTESKIRQHPSNPVQTEVVQQQKTRQIQHYEKENSVVLQQDNIYKCPVNPIPTEVIQQQNLHSLNRQQNMQQQHHHQQQLQHLQNRNILKPQENFYTSEQHQTTAHFRKPHQNDAKVVAQHDHGIRSPQRTTHFFHGNHHQYRNHFNDNRDRYRQHDSQPAVSSSNHHMWGPERQQHRVQPRQWCRYYREGRCHYGENC